jgi:hypothetical protein
MLKRETFAIADIFVSIKRRATLEQKRVDEIAASMLDKARDPDHGAVRWSALCAESRVCTGWKLPRRLARRPSLDSASRRESIDLLRIFTVCCRYSHSRIAAVFFRPLLAQPGFLTA